MTIRQLCNIADPLLHRIVYVTRTTVSLTLESRHLLHPTAGVPLLQALADYVPADQRLGVYRQLADTGRATYRREP